MLFNSYPFIFAFLPLTFIVFFALARRSHALAAGWLTAASLFFYAWWRPSDLGLLLASIAFNYVLGRGIAQAAADGRRRRARCILAIAVAVDLLVLGYFKYANFFLDSINALAETQWSLGAVVLPLGISFFTFTQISFLVDAYRGQVRSYRVVHYALFVTYFPHLIAGPILHHAEMIPQFRRDATYRPDPMNLAVGLTVFSIGLFKKVLIADTMGAFSTPSFAAAARGEIPALIPAWGGVLAYTLQLYFDFSGYSDMAIGLSRLFGVDLPVNFNSPYKAQSIIEFWRRWHMTLSRFLRDYLYIPLGGSRCHPARRYVNLLVTMLLGGLWHGAGWNFVAWGGLHGLYLVINHGWRALREASRSTGVSSGPWGRTCARLLTFLAVVVAWVFFRADTFAAALRMLDGMAGGGGFVVPDYLGEAARSLAFVAILADLGWPVSASWLLATLIGLLLAIVWLAPNTQQLMGPYNRALEPYPVAPGRSPASAWHWQPTPAMAMGVGALLFASLLGLLTEKPSEFLYFQF
jgi:alginate O-acetyltransferase complex protein AlgI